MQITLGHFLIGFYFVFFGFWNIIHWQSTKKAMIEKHIPLPALTLGCGILLQSLAGSALILGLYTHLAALALMAFTILAVLMFHAFWQDKGKTRALNQIIFITHLTCTLGALCLIMEG